MHTDRGREERVHIVVEMEGGREREGGRGRKREGGRGREREGEKGREREREREYSAAPSIALF